MSSPEIVPKCVPQAFPTNPLIKSPLSHPESREVIPTFRGMFNPRHVWRSQKESE